VNVTLRRAATSELTASEIEAVRRILWAAFDHPDDPDEAMTEEDWQHALGGTHILVEVDGRIVGHASVVERELQVDGRPLRAGYVEAVAIDPPHQRTGLGSRLMSEIDAVIEGGFDIGALGTGSPEFYERLGWLRWAGPTFVRAPDGLQRTAEEDGGIMVLRTPRSPSDLDLTASISCEWRTGDVW
jgi:aminoglycoside 2'-N-acetyltransferase I